MRDHARTLSLQAIPWLLAVAVGVGCNGNPVVGSLGDAGDGGAAADVSDVPLDLATDVALDTPPSTGRPRA